MGVQQFSAKCQHIFLGRLQGMSAEIIGDWAFKKKHLIRTTNHLQKVIFIHVRSLMVQTLTSLSFAFTRSTMACLAFFCCTRSRLGACGSGTSPNPSDPKKLSAWFSWSTKGFEQPRYTGICMSIICWM